MMPPTTFLAASSAQSTFVLGATVFAAAQKSASSPPRRRSHPTPPRTQAQPCAAAAVPSRHHEPQQLVAPLCPVLSSSLSTIAVSLCPVTVIDLPRQYRRISLAMPCHLRRLLQPAFLLQAATPPHPVLHRIVPPVAAPTTSLSTTSAPCRERTRRKA
jgi:hypothetical protein